MSNSTEYVQRRKIHKISKLQYSPQYLLRKIIFIRDFTLIIKFHSSVINYYPKICNLFLISCITTEQTRNSCHSSWIRNVEYRVSEENTYIVGYSIKRKILFVMKQDFDTRNEFKASLGHGTSVILLITSRAMDRGFSSRKFEIRTTFLTTFDRIPMDKLFLPLQSRNSSRVINEVTTSSRPGNTRKSRVK